jgi:hypothetical protein
MLMAFRNLGPRARKIEQSFFTLLGDCGMACPTHRIFGVLPELISL